MKRTMFYAALLTLLATVAAANRFSSATGSLVRIEGTSTLHAWKMEGGTIDGQITAPPIDEWQNGNPAANVTVAIPVKSIKSEHTRMDKLMAEALKAGTNPEIRYAMTSASLKQADASTFVVNTQGRLTIAGVTRDVEMQILGTRDGAQYVLTGRVPIKMTDYGIKPPTAMMGTIRTGDAVAVTIRWVVGAAN